MTSQQAPRSPSLTSQISITSLEEPLDEPVPDGGIAVDIPPNVEYNPRHPFPTSTSPTQQWGFKLLALFTACLLSLGSHYGSYLLGPLKSSLARQLGTSNTQFSLLIASFGLNNTWTPLVAGVFTARRGTAVSSIVATSLVLLGQGMMLIGRTYLNVPFMTLGCFVFGLGISPLAVAQETIICRFFDKHGLGVSLALGLVAGKGASFLSSITSYPLSTHFSPIAPFVVSTMLAGLSFSVNIIYLYSSRWLSRNAGIRPDGEIVNAPDSIADLDTIPTEETKILSKRKVRITDLHRLGDPFWIYMGLNVLCGTIWSPFLHLAANIIQRRYTLSESSAAKSASLLLAGPLILYPLCGIITDLAKTKNAFIVHHLFLLSSILTLFCYIWLCLPVSLTGGPIPGVISWGIGHGFSTLLLVIVVPGLVPVKYVSTALGAHKSIESCGSTLATTLAGILLDKSVTSKTPIKGESITAGKNDEKAVHNLLLIFLTVNIVQLGFVIWLWRVDVRKTKETEEECMKLEESEVEDPLGSAVVDVDIEGEINESTSLLPPSTPQKKSLKRSSSALTPLIERYRARSFARSSSTGIGLGTAGEVLVIHGKELVDLVKGTKGMATTRSERTRGRRFMIAYGALVLVVWVVFLTTAVVKLRKKVDGEGN